MNWTEKFILRTIADENLLIPTGAAALKIKGLVALSETGALLYRKLAEGCSHGELVVALTAEYDVDAETAARDVDAFLKQMQELEQLTRE